MFYFVFAYKNLLPFSTTSLLPINMRYKASYQFKFWKITNGERDKSNSGDKMIQ